MLTINSNLERGLANGTPTSIQSFNLNLQSYANSITVTINYSREFLKLRRHTIQYKFTFNMKFYKSMFSLPLAYAMTGHKCQGAILYYKVLIDIYKAFSAGLTYVMLSRVAGSRYMKIARLLHPDDFMPMLYSRALFTVP
jgi:hypothetical protein